MSRFTSRICALWLVLLCGALSSLPVAGQNKNPGLAQGTEEDSVYLTGDIDSVNLYNGNLTLNIPLGSTYEVGGNLAYELRLFYNSSAGWEIEDEDGARCQAGAGNPNVDFTVWEASKLTNAGLGWTVSLGRLIPTGLGFDSQLKVDRWTYIEPNGHRRGLYSTLHNGVGAATDIAYTNDGSYMRLKRNATGCHNVPAGGGACHVLEFADGTFHEFHDVEAGNTGFRPTYMADRFGNWVNIDYTASSWTIEDRHGRHQIIDFETGVNGLPRIDQIRLTSFGDNPSNPGAVYDFQYGQQTLDRHQLQHFAAGLNCSQPPRYIGTSQTVPATVAVDALQKVVLPDQSFYEPTYYASDDVTDGRSGAIKSLRLPTAASFDWQYTDRYGMNVNNREDLTILRPGDRVLGVKKKRRFEDGSVTGAWTYEHRFSIYNSEHDPIPGLGNIPCYHKTDVKFFAQDPGDTTPPLLWDRYFFASARNRWQAYHGMGFSPCVPDDPDGTNYDGPAISEQNLDSNGNVLRETYVLYDLESTTGHGSLYEKNIRLREQVVEYHDDLDGSGNPRFSRETWGYNAANTGSNPQDYDGLGNFRTYRLDGNLPLGRNRKEIYTKFGVRGGSLTDLSYAPAPGDPWVLETYEEVRTTEGSSTDGHVARELFCFDQATGFLEGQRSMVTNNPGSGDIVVQYDESFGQTTRETYYGGDFVNLGGDDRCSVGVGASYVVSHDYQAGVRSKTEFLDGSQVVHRSLDVDIDTATGLVETQRNPSGIGTDFVYDSMGRVLQEKPAVRAWRNFQYLHPTVSNPNRALEVNLRVCANGSSNCNGSGALEEHLTDFNRRGLQIKEERRMPSADGTGSRLVERKMAYDALGRTTSQQVWRDAGVSGFDFKTLYQDYDRFGRPGKVIAPDGSQTTYDYDGERFASRTFSVATPSGPQSSTVEEYRDVKDRLVLVREQSGSGTNWVNTTYEYDEGDRLIQICVNDGDDIGTNTCSGQQRKYEYDDRGLLKQEEHPELGRSNNTDRRITYFYDALGNVTVHSLFGNHLDRNFVHDKAGRVVQVLRPTQVGGSVGERLLQEFFYLRPGSGVCGGVLHQAKQHNRVPLPGSNGTEHDVVVTETFGHDPNDACRLTDYGVRSSQAEGFRALRFSTELTYNALGNITRIDYPDCTNTPGCTPGSSQVDFSYDHGLLRTVGGTASLTYHPTGQVHTVAHTQGVTDTYERFSNVWKPLSRITVSGLANSADWVYGPFDYDGAQNITRIGTSSGDETFAYDRVGRLVSSTIRSSTGAKDQNLTYDVYGNLTQIATSDGTLNIALDANSRNRLAASHGASYDVAGSLTNLQLGGVSYTYHRDALNRIRRLEGGGVDRSFLYTAGGERFATLDLATETSQWTVRDLENRLLSSFERRDGLQVDWKKDYMHGAGKQLASAIPDGVGGDVLRHFHLDHLGSTRLITDHNAQVVTRNTFYPFGGYTAAPVSGTEVLQFAAHERDDLGGNLAGHLDYMHARYYTPTMGRFLSIDPASDSMDPASPQSWNRYAYSFNNPMRFNDPDGRTPDTFLDLGFLAIDAGIAAYEYFKDGEVSTLTKAALAADTVALFTPIATGGGPAVRLAAAAGKVDDGAQAAAAAVRATRETRNATKAAQLADKALESRRVDGGRGGGRGRGRNQRGDGGNKTLYFGDGFKQGSKDFHGPGKTKSKILDQVKGFENKVGKNPDVKVVNGKIRLVGSNKGPFKGKSFETDLDANKFFDK